MPNVMSIITLFIALAASVALNTSISDADEIKDMAGIKTHLPTYLKTKKADCEKSLARDKTCRMVITFVPAENTP